MASGGPNLWLSGHIQHTLYRIGLTESDIEEHCRACIEFGFAAAMVPGRWVPRSAALLAGSGIRVASAVDFPFGLQSDTSRVQEAQALVEAGAQEIDLAVPIGLLRAGDASGFRNSIARVVAAVRPVEVKVMLELPLLTSDLRDHAVDLAVEAGAQWLKNASSGSVGAATPADIAYLRARAPKNVRIKASGGITTFETATALLDAGAELLGTSNGPSLVRGHTAAGDY